jgi:hypothetical protein
MTVRRSPAARKPASQNDDGANGGASLVSLRAVVLIVIAVGCGVLAVSHPGWALGIGTAVVVLTLLDSIVGS